MNGRRFDLALREHRDGACVVGFASVLMNRLMQRGADRHRVQQQNQNDQETANGQLSGLTEMSFCALQILRNLAAAREIATFLKMIMSINLSGGERGIRTQMPCGAAANRVFVRINSRTLLRMPA